jgi:hypothetical protein
MCPSSVAVSLPTPVIKGAPGMSLTLTKITETSSTITLGWTPPASVDAYVFYANGQVVSVATANNKDGSPRKEVKFSKTSPGPPFTVAAVVSPGADPAIEFDSYPDSTEPPPDPPPSGVHNKLSEFNGVFLPTWTQPSNITQGVTNPAGLGGGVREISDAAGSGFQFVATPQMKAPWQSTKKICFGQFPIRKAVGGMETWTFKYRYPRALNPSGLANGWQGGHVFEFGHHTPNSGILIASDGRAPDGGDEGHVLWVPKAPWDTGSFDYYKIGDKVLWDHDYVVEAKIRYRPDATGYVKITIDGRVIIDANRPTRPNTSEIPLCQPGWYSEVGSDKNGCEIRNLTYSYAA